MKWRSIEEDFHWSVSLCTEAQTHVGYAAEQWSETYQKVYIFFSYSKKPKTNKQKKNNLNEDFGEA